MARSKKEIDKELMYKKILPTAMLSEPAVERVTEGTASKQEQPPVIAEPRAVTPIEPMQEAVEPAPIESVITDAKAAEPVAELPEKQPEERPIINLMEGFVESRIDEAMKKFNCCQCEKCRKDVLAIALNKLSPFYVIEDDPNLRDVKERERAADVATALVQAILTVKNNPTH